MEKQFNPRLTALASRYVSTAFAHYFVSLTNLDLQSTYEAASSTAQGWGTFSYAGPTTVSLASVYNYEFC